MSVSFLPRTMGHEPGDASRPAYACEHCFHMQGCSKRARFEHDGLAGVPPARRRRPRVPFAPSRKLYQRSPAQAPAWPGWMRATMFDLMPGDSLRPVSQREICIGLRCWCAGPGGAIHCALGRDRKIGARTARGTRAVPEEQTPANPCAHLLFQDKSRQPRRLHGYLAVAREWEVQTWPVGEMR